MLSRLILLQLSRREALPELLGTIYSALTITSYYQVVASSSRPELQFSSRQELMAVLHLALDWP